MNLPALVITLITIIISSNLMACAQPQKIKIPAGRTIDVKVVSEINAETNNKGQSITARLEKPFYNDGTYILPAGSSIQGYIAHIKKPAYENVNAELKVIFNKIITPQGKTIPILAEIETKDGTGLIVGHPRSTFSKVKSGAFEVGKKTGTTAAKTAAIRAVTPKKILTGIGIGKTIHRSKGIVDDVRKKENKKAAIATGKEVVKYTPYGTAYKLTDSAVKGVKVAKKKDGPPGMGSNIIIKQGKKLDIVLKKPVVISNY